MKKNNINKICLKCINKCKQFNFIINTDTNDKSKLILNCKKFKPKETK